ncbi:MAG TPA: alpha/beta fold hydrolase [Thermoanaerobaculia bacterium]|nr:alpha/beta fold hydrolase [Thermoanaerobaculia bacterium]
MIVALHGFLGHPSDWDFLRDAGFEVRAPNLFEGDEIGSGDVLLGYSMGGRLALHALLAGAAFSRAVIVSAGLGIEDENARAARRVADEVWACRFESDRWQDVVRDWHAQPIFAGHSIARDERDFDRASLAKALREWSPAALPPVASRLHELRMPILFVAGERDAKYVAEAKRAAELVSNAELWVAPGAAHRVPWEVPDAFAERLRAFID